jgi:hypothetical protein
MKLKDFVKEIKGHQGIEDLAKEVNEFATQSRFEMPGKFI